MFISAARRRSARALVFGFRGEKNASSARHKTQMVLTSDGER